MDQFNIRWMKAALELGRRGQGNTGSNPSVGCVLVKDGILIGQGFTAPSGRPHAEAVALSQAGQNAIGATAYVTLEPCVHEGRGSPCVSSLITANVARVVIALVDPDPRVAGQGIAVLKGAGIEVESGVCAQDAAWDLAGYLRSRLDGLPFVTLKIAATFDGKIALGNGESKWITGTRARCWGHLLRSQHDAIVTGAKTVRVDNPALTARVPGLQGYDPKPYLLSSAEGLTGEYQILKRADVILARNGHDRLPNPRDVLIELARNGHTRVMIEGGSGVASLFLKAGLVDQITLFQAPTFIGCDGLNAVGFLKIFDLKDMPRWEILDSITMGHERYLTLRYPAWLEEVKRYV